MLIVKWQVRQISAQEFWFLKVCTRIFQELGHKINASGAPMSISNELRPMSRTAASVKYWTMDLCGPLGNQFPVLILRLLWRPKHIDVGFCYLRISVGSFTGALRNVHATSLASCHWQGKIFARHPKNLRQPSDSKL